MLRPTSNNIKIDETEIQAAKVQHLLNLLKRFHESRHDVQSAHAGSLEQQIFLEKKSETSLVPLVSFFSGCRWRSSSSSRSSRGTTCSRRSWTSASRGSGSATAAWPRTTSSPGSTAGGRRCTTTFLNLRMWTAMLLDNGSPNLPSGSRCDLALGSVQCSAESRVQRPG